MVWGLFRKPYTIRKDRKKLILLLKIPGFLKKNFRLDIKRKYIYIRAERKEQFKIKKKGFFKQEKGYSTYNNSFSLPCEVIPKKTRWDYRDGILKIEIPKAGI